MSNMALIILTHNGVGRNRICKIPAKDVLGVVSNRLIIYNMIYCSLIRR